MAKSGPEKIEVRATAPEVKEGLSLPTSEVVTVVESFAQLLQKINDIDDARKALGTAKTLFTDGKVDEARELAFGIFARLKQVGKAPAKLDIANVQELITANKYEVLVERIKGVQDKGAAKGVAEAGELADELETMPKKKGKEQEGVTKKVQSFVEAGGKRYEQQERELQEEFSEFLETLEERNKKTIDQDIHNVRLQIDQGLIGEVDVKKQVESLRRKVGDKVKERIEGRTSSIASRDAKVAESLEGSQNRDALEQIADRVKQGKLGEKALMLRLGHLMNGMNKVRERVERGVGLQEAIRTLDQNEIREMRTFLASLTEVQDATERSPYYDEQYVAFVKDLNMGKDDIIALEKMIESVDMHYRTEQLERGTTQPQQQRRIERQEGGRRGRVDRFLDKEQIMDAESGKPAYGSDLGLLTPEQQSALYNEGEEVFRELFEELPNGTFRERDVKHQLAGKLEQQERLSREYGLQRNEQREAFLNINMQELFKYMRDHDQRQLEMLTQQGREGEYVSMFEMIDYEFYVKHQVAKLKDEYMSPVNGTKEKDRKDLFEKWWYQEAAFQQRSLAYEGLFERRNQSPRMQRLNSLMEIVGVGTEKKGLANWMAMSYSMIDQQNNSYVNEEFMGKLAGFWTNQGVDFRLEDMLKEFREEVSVTGKDGSRRIIRDRDGQGALINVFDAVSFMQQEVPHDMELRKQLGIPEWWKGKWGTYIYKYSETGTRGKARGAAWEYFMDKDLNVDVSKMGDTEKKEVSNKYQLMFDLAFNYAVAHKNLHQMLGNASFRKGEFELPAACAEMHLKLDPILYSRAFAPRYTWLNVGFKEGWALFDPGLRDYVTMAPQDYASHFTQFSKDNPTAMETENGSPTLIKTFLMGGKERAVTDADVAAAGELYSVFDKALWHWGAGKPKKHGEETDIFMEWGVDGDKKSAFRRPAGEAAKVLLENRPSKATLDAIDWSAYYDIVKNPRIERRMRAAGSSEERWRIFAETFGEHSFNHATPSAKRSGDHPVKYGVERFNKYVETFLGWINDPFNQEKFDALLDVPTAINAGAVNGMAEKNMEFLMTMSETMGRRELLGGSMTRLWRNPKDNTTKFDTSKGINGEGDSEWPSYKTEKITNSRWIFDPIQHKSIPGSVGIGVPEDRQIMIDLLKGQRAKGRLSDDLYRKYYRKIVNGTWWEGKQGLVNVYRWATLTPVTDWLASQLGVAGWELRDVIMENSEKTGEKALKYIFS